MANRRDFNEIIEEMAIVSDELFSTAFDKRPDRAEFLIKDVLEYLGYKDFKVKSSKTQIRNSHPSQNYTVANIEVELKSSELIIVEVQLAKPEHFSSQKEQGILAPHDFTKLKERMDPSDLPPQILIVISVKDLNNLGIPIAT